MNNNEYLDFIKDVMLKINILYLGQLRRMLWNTFPELRENKEYDKEIVKAQDNGIILITHNHYVITKPMYEIMTADKFYDGIDKNSVMQVPEEMRVYSRDKEGKRYCSGTTTIDKYLQKNKEIKDLLNCMWVVAKYMPDSKNFIVASSPWHILFEKEDKTTVIENNPQNSLEPIVKENTSMNLIEITYIPENAEDSRIEMIKAVGNMPNRMRPSIRRIAIIENEAHLWKIPYYGFTDIFVNDNNESVRCKKVERRASSEAWKDFRDIK